MFLHILGSVVSLILPNLRFFEILEGIPVKTHGETSPREFIKRELKGLSEQISPFLKG